MLVYLNSYLNLDRFVWLDRTGKQLGTAGEADTRYWPVLSPDGRTAVFSRNDPADLSKGDLWRLDTQPGTTSRVTFEGGCFPTAVWSPDGTQLAVAWVTRKTEIIPASGSGTPRILENGVLLSEVSDWSRDGRTLVANQQNSGTGMDVLTLDTSGMQPPTPILHSQFDEMLPRLSPDGRWLAYISNQSGRFELYVVPFPGLNGRWQVSSSGISPEVPSTVAWSRDGKQLYTRDTTGALTVVDVQTQGGEFHAGVPRQIFSPPGGVSGFDTAPDGRILALVPVEPEMSPPITLVMNWDAELIKK